MNTPRKTLGNSPDPPMRCLAESPVLRETAIICSAVGRVTGTRRSIAWCRWTGIAWDSRLGHGTGGWGSGSESEQSAARQEHR